MTSIEERFEFRNIRPEEADQAAQIEQICFPPNEACSEKMMKERVLTAPEFFLVAVDKETGKIAGFLNGLATDEEALRDEFLRTPGFMIRRERTSCCWDWMCCRITGDRDLRLRSCPGIWKENGSREERPSF